MLVGMGQYFHKRERVRTELGERGDPKERDVSGVRGRVWE